MRQPRPLANAATVFISYHSYQALFNPKIPILEFRLWILKFHVPSLFHFTIRIVDVRQDELYQIPPFAHRRVCVSPQALTIALGKLIY